MEEKQLIEIVNRAQQGDMDAFSQIYIMFSPQIKAIIDSIIHDSEESKDLMQECFLSALKNIENLKEPEKIKKWLIRIAANKSKDFLKKKKPDLLEKDQEYVIDDIVEENPDSIPEQCVEVEERRQEVNEMLDTLSEDKKLCLLLFYKHNMSISEISEELGVTESAIKSRLSRARQDIAEEAEKRKKKGMPLFTVAPFTLVIIALREAADISAASFAGSASQSAILAGVVSASGAGAAAVGTSGAVTAISGAATSSAVSTATTGTAGIVAKFAALGVAQKVVIGVVAASIATGSVAGAAVAIKTNIEDKPVLAYTEEYTTLPETNSDLPETEVEMIFTESQESILTESATETETESETETTTREETETKKSFWDKLFGNDETKTTKKSTTEKTSRATTSRKETTKKSTNKVESSSKETTVKTTTEKATTTKATATKATTTKVVTTKPITTKVTTTRTTTTRVTTTKPTTTKTTTTKATTTKPTTTKTTTTKPTTTKPTTTKPTTTAAPTTTKPTTTASQKATVNVLVYGIGADATDKTYKLTFNSGEVITADIIQSRLYDEYGVAAMVDDINTTAQAGKTYSATAYG